MLLTWSKKAWEKVEANLKVWKETDAVVEN